MMKESTLRYLLLAFSVIVFWRCSKPYSEALPTVQVTSVIPYGFVDSVLVTGTITSSGASPIEYEGISFSNTPTFDLLSRQLLLSTTTTTFSAVLPAYHDSTFYFEAFAANEYGYSVSNTYKYTVPAAQPDSAPCSIPQNTVIFSSTNYTPFDILWGGSPPYGSFYVEADFGFSYAVDIYFNQVPINGRYSVLNTSDFIDNPSAYVATIILDNSYSFNESGYVYVSQNKNGSTTVSFCSLVVDVSSTNYTTSAKITFN